ncbi:4-hydroxy-tetrahydrodipicolinate synthase [soil metagenome]
MFHGSMVAIVTPMHLDGSIDEASLRRLIDWHIAEGTQAIIIIGTTGESPTLTAKEKVRVIKIAVEQAAGRVPVIAGTGSNSTSVAIENAQNAMAAGADACLVITPYCNKPTQEGLYLHFKAIAEAVALPMILYNVPSRTACDLLPATIARLSSISNIVGVKEATGKLERVGEILAACNNKIDVYSGDDATALDLILLGARGVISVTANMLPKAMYEICALALKGEKEKALQLNQPLMSLHKALFLEANPIPLKWALHQMGLIPAGIRLPLTPLSEQYHQSLPLAMHEAGIKL